MNMFPVTVCVDFGEEAKQEYPEKHLWDTGHYCHNSYSHEMQNTLAYKTHHSA